VGNLRDNAIWESEKVTTFFEMCHSQNEVPPLLFASKYTGYEDIIEILIAHGEDLNEINSNEQTTLMLCCENSLITSTKNLIYSGAKINMQDKVGRSALMYACFNGEKEIVHFLLERGADFELKDTHGKTALMYAVTSANEEIVETILAINPKLDVKDESGNTAVTYSAQLGLNDILGKLLNVGADLDVQDANGRTALMSAVAKEQKSMTEMLIASGANINIKDENGVAALSLGVITGQEGIVENLLVAGAEVDSTDNNGNTAIFGIKEILENTTFTLAKESLNEILNEETSSFSNDFEKEELTTISGEREDIGEEIVKVSGQKEEEDNNVTRIADYKEKDHSKEIQKIKKLNTKEITNDQLKKMITLLNNHYADIDLKNNKGVKANSISQKCTNKEVILKLETFKNKERPNNQSSTDKAEVQDNTSDNRDLTQDEMMDYLKTNHQDPETNALEIPDKLLQMKNGKGQNLLMLASLLGTTSIVEEILNHNINVNLKDKKGYRALSYAAKAGHCEIIELLCKNNAQVEPTDSSVHSPLTLAVLSDQVEAVETLAKLGANLNKKNKGVTLLMLMASRGNMKMVEALIRSKADVYAKDFKGKSASAYANDNSYKDIYRFLKKHEI